jgi:hypothetical protein
MCRCHDMSCGNNMRSDVMHVLYFSCTCHLPLSCLRSYIARPTPDRSIKYVFVHGAWHGAGRAGLLSLACGWGAGELGSWGAGEQVEDVVCGMLGRRRSLLGDPGLGVYHSVRRKYCSKRKRHSNLIVRLLYSRRAFIISPLKSQRK